MYIFGTLVSMNRKTETREDRAREFREQELLRDLEEAARRLGIRVRTERGTFRSDLCEVQGESMIILNRRLSTADRATVLARILCRLDLEEVHLSPRTREFLEECRQEPAGESGNQGEEE